MRKFYVAKGFEKDEPCLPQRKTKLSAGYDIAVVEKTVIEPKEIKLVHTGIKVQMNEDEVFLIFPRSSLAKKKGLTLANNVGVIDSDYFENEENDGEIGLLLQNFSEEVVKIKKGERVAQGIFVKYLKTEDDFIEEKRTGGYGSTGSL